MSNDKTKVLDVGQCMPDHMSIIAMLSDAFDATVDQAHAADEAFEAVRSGDYDLVLVNRIFDADGDCGLELIRRLQANDSTRAVPVMLVSNYPESQAEAVDLGAQPGFGKSALNDKATVDGLAALLRR